MANYSELLNDINAAIYENNDQEIDALEVRAILREMVTSLGSGYLFKGIATPSSPSGTGTYEPDQNVFYLATTAGTYTYLGGLVVAAGEVAFLCFDGTWTKKSSALLSTGSIVDNTTTEDATKPLSAKQGKVLKDGQDATSAELTALGHKVVKLSAEVIGEAGTFYYDCKAAAAGMYFNGTAIVASTAGANGIVIPVEKGVNYRVQLHEPKIYNDRFFTAYPTIGGPVGVGIDSSIRTPSGYTPTADGYVLVSFDAALKYVEWTKGQSGIENDLDEISTELSNFETTTNSGINSLDGRLDVLESSQVLNVSDSEVKLIEENVLNESGEQLTLPIIYGDGYGRFIGVSGKLYAGAANLVRLLLKPGSVTYNGVTLTIDKDGWITMTGTATGDGVISYTNLKGYAGADSAKADLTIPEMPSGNYELAIAQRGTSSKATIYARASASSSWLALLTITSPHTTIDISAVGAFVAYLINGTTYNEHFRFMIMPKAIYDVMPNLSAFFSNPWPVDVEMFDTDGIHIANYVVGDGSATTIEKLLPLTNYATNNVRCAWFGDSISQFMQLPHLVGRKMAISVDDCSFGGAPLAYSSEEYEDTGVCSLFEQIANNDFSPCETAINLQYAHSLITQAQRDAKLAQLAYIETIDFSEVDKIVVFAGTNDLSVASATLANIKSYFTSAVTALLTAYPQLQVYVILPIYRSDAYTTHPNGLTLPDINGAIQEVAVSFGFPCLDGLKNCGINSVNHTHWLTDGLHQNDAGDDMLSTRFANWLNSIF